MEQKSLVISNPFWVDTNTGNKKLEFMEMKNTNSPTTAFRQTVDTT